MGKWFVLQAFYCLSGIAFFIQDMMAKVPMQTAMINAFIWPYAQWGVMKAYTLQAIAPVMKLIS